MPRPRSNMRQIREVLRLTMAEGMSPRQVASSLGVARTTVQRYVRMAEACGLSWPLPDGMDDRDLEVRLFGPRVAPVRESRPEPDWEEVHRELKRPHVTLQLLHHEYKERHPDGYQYTRFWEGYQRWRRHLDAVMRQEHRAGEKLFVDFAGDRIAIVDPASGAVACQAEIFVAVLGASNYTYAEAFPSQELVHWIGGHIHAFEFLGGCPQIVVPDNLRSGVTKAHRYEPELNQTYQEMAAHYGVTIIPARPRKPRDKAKVEAGVLIVERWLIASLRHRTFHSIAELNQAIRERLQWVNERPFKKLEGCRRSLFEDLDRPALKPLPARPYQFAIWRQATVNIDYHVEVEGHWYSVPYQLVGERCDVRIGAATVEVLHHHRRVASHVRSTQKRHHTTVAEHMPESHRRHLEWTPSRIVSWGHSVGPKTAEVVESILQSRPHPEQGYRSCLGIFRLGKRFAPERLEAACARALAINALNYKSVESILKRGLDRQPLPAAQPLPAHPRHDNVRGPDYYT